MGNKGRAVIISLLSLCVCAVIVVVGSYALFTGKSTVNNHLKAGNLRIGMYRTEYQIYALNEEGLLEKNTDQERVDLVKDATPVFEVEGAVPYSHYQAKIEVKNEGSVAFEHSVSMLFDSKKASAAQLAFAKQLQITITYGKESRTFLLCDCEKAENALPLGVLLKGEQTEFTVKAEFLNDANNDIAQEQPLVFDVQVRATQYVNE